MTSREKFDIARKEAAARLYEKGLEFVYIACYGSDNYGLAYEKSDMDVKVIVVPSLHSIVSNSKPISETWDFEWGQADIKDVRLMCENWMKQNTNFLEILFTDYFYINPNYLAATLTMLSHREEIARIDEGRHMRASLGMQDQKYHALKHPFPSKIEIIEKYGYDPKQLSHIVRLYDLMTKYIKGKSYKECITPTGEIADYIKAIKTAAYHTDIETVEELARKYMKMTDELYENYKEKATTCEAGIAALDTFRYSVIREALKKEVAEV